MIIFMWFMKFDTAIFCFACEIQIKRIAQYLERNCFTMIVRKLKKILVETQNKYAFSEFISTHFVRSVESYWLRQFMHGCMCVMLHRIKAFKIVTRYAFKNAIYCQALYLSHEISGNNSKWYFLYLRLVLSVCFHTIKTFG